MSVPVGPGRRSARSLGLLAMSGAIVAFSLGSTIVKKSGIPGPTMAFYRMILTSVLWAVVLRVTEHRFVTRAELRHDVHRVNEERRDVREERREHDRPGVREERRELKRAKGELHRDARRYHRQHHRR